MAEEATRFAETTSDKRKALSFSRWLSHARHQISLQSQAEQIHSIRVKSSVLAKWTTAQSKMQTNYLNADKARAFFLQREAIKCWSLRLARKRQTRAVEERRLKDLKAVFNGTFCLHISYFANLIDIWGLDWREATAAKRLEDSAVRTFQEAQDQVCKGSEVC